MILFVDINDTCRAPIAAACAGTHGLTACSAGVYSMEGLGPDAAAVRAARAQGLDLSGHTARSLEDPLLAQADAVYCMTAAIARHLREERPECAVKLRPFAEIGDPFGGSEEGYAACVQQIRRGVEALL